ncbi:efflux RND transporter periplasmic adaptor subunit [Niallia sp. 01092]|uniref:efflux RND transporter periplasmic adaptor subunit n=1 Tax=unclassified Niallia TaxID=2837522 RepID=UPI003FD411CF
MNWKKSALFIVIILFIGANITLLLKTKHPFDHSTYVHAWTKAAERDLVQRLGKEGISLPLEKQTVYLDKSKGDFSGFLVKNGEFVESNTPLLAYKNNTAKNSTDELALEIQQLEKERSSLQVQVGELSRLLSSLSSSPPNLDENNENENNENDNNENNNNNNEHIATSVQQQILDKQQEQAKVAAVIEKKQALLQMHRAGLANSLERSTISGYIAEVKEDLANPIITVVSKDQKVEGLLKEAERTKIKEGMEVLVKDSSGKEYTGAVDYVSALPKDHASIKKESLYPFTIKLNEQPKEMVSGTHVNVQIITKKVLNAISIPKKSVLSKKGSDKIYVIENGFLAKKGVQTGLQVDGYQQITMGVKKGDIVIIPSVNKKISNHPYITPIKVKEWRNLTIENRRKKELLRYVLKGFL